MGPAGPGHGAALAPAMNGGRGEPSSTSRALSRTRVLYPSRGGGACDRSRPKLPPRGARRINRPPTVQGTVPRRKARHAERQLTTRRTISRPASPRSTVRAAERRPWKAARGSLFPRRVAQITRAQIAVQYQLYCTTRYSIIRAMTLDASTHTVRVWTIPPAFRAVTEAHGRANGRRRVACVAEPRERILWRSHVELWRRSAAPGRGIVCRGYCVCVCVCTLTESTARLASSARRN